MAEEIVHLASGHWDHVTHQRKDGLRHPAAKYVKSYSSTRIFSFNQKKKKTRIFSSTTWEEASLIKCLYSEAIPYPIFTRLNRHKGIEATSLCLHATKAETGTLRLKTFNWTIRGLRYMSQTSNLTVYSYCIAWETIYFYPRKNHSITACCETSFYFYPRTTPSYSYCIAWDTIYFYPRKNHSITACSETSFYVYPRTMPSYWPDAESIDSRSLLMPLIHGHGVIITGILDVKCTASERASYCNQLIGSLS